MYLGNYLRGRLADGFTFITVIFSACLIYLLRIIIWHFDILFEWIRAANVVSSRDRIYIRIYIYVLYTYIYMYIIYVYTQRVRTRENLSTYFEYNARGVDTVF